MTRCSRKMAAAVCLCASVGALWSGQAGGDAGAATQPVTVGLKNPEVAKDLAAALGDADPAVREGAQKQVDALPLSSLADLRRLTNATTDPEARARLQRRLDELDDIVALNPELITLHMKDASMRDVTQALSGLTGTAILSSADTQTYSLDVQDALFSDVIKRLSERGLGISNSSPRLTLQSTLHSPEWLSVRPKAAVAVDAARLTLGGDGSALRVPFTVVTDPRAQFVMKGLHRIHGPTRKHRRHLSSVPQARCARRR